MWAKTHRVDVLIVGKDLCLDVGGKGNHIASSEMNLTWNILGSILQDVAHDSNVQLIKNECGRDEFQVRDDPRTDVRRDALQTLHHCNTTVSDVELNANSFSAVRTLDTDVVEFFIVMRENLREVEMPGVGQPTLVPM